MDGLVVTVVSGGLDSVILAHYIQSLGYKQRIISFDYGQKHKKELDMALECAIRIECRWDVVNLQGLADLLPSALTTKSTDVPDGHYAADNMKVTVVPNRNAIMLSMAFGVATSCDAVMVAAGMHAGDHFVYPDCRPEFVNRLSQALALGNEGFCNTLLHISAPFIRMSKADIVRLGHKLDVPMEKTWSCYKGGRLHCGVCGTCVERREAFVLADLYDPTTYEHKPDVKVAQ